MSTWQHIVISCSSCGKQIVSRQVNDLTSIGETVGRCGCGQQYRYKINKGIVSGNVKVQKD
ncbi:MAG: hypothetical protein IJ187_05465 [Neisseriaceae bacterium]|nr:hypothetical protein [Neisseriaceae bacterium]